MTRNTAHPINCWLVENKIFIKDNPAVSCDMTLDFARLTDDIRHDGAALAEHMTAHNSEPLKTKLDKIIFWNRSRFSAGKHSFFLVESIATGDCALVSAGGEELAFEDVAPVEPSLQAIPLYWPNLIALKNLVQQNDPHSTLFPVAADSLEHTSLGIGARFTTLHWPGVAWAMKHLGLSLTANQNSIPRELVYDINAMSEGRLSELPFPFIGGNVPEGHQGQSVQGMSHAAVITYLKYGFQKNGIAWGFNADHQPIGGRFDEIEKELVGGSLLASYITYDLSPELAQHAMTDDSAKLETALEENVGISLYNRILAKLREASVSIDESEAKKLIVYLMPAMEKMKRRDSLYRAIREANFTTDIGRRFHKELSIDELPGQTTPQTLGVALAMAEAMDVKFQFVAPNIGFQKNFYSPFQNSLSEMIALWGGSSKPVIAGEFPVGGLEATTKNSVAMTPTQAYEALWKLGYSGGFTWSNLVYTNMSASEKANVDDGYTALYNNHLKGRGLWEIDCDSSTAAGTMTAANESFCVAISCSGTQLRITSKNSRYFTISVYNARGALFISKAGKNGETIRLAKKVPGLAYVRIKGEKGSLFKKAILY